MNKRLLFLLSVLSIVPLLGGCASGPIAPDFVARDLNGLLARGYVQRADNLYLVFDASASMGEGYGETSRFAVAKETLRRLNATIPDIPLTAGLRVFGPVTEAGSNNVLVFGIVPYDRSAFIGSLEPFAHPEGLTSTANAIDAANVDLQMVKGRTAVIVIGDGEDTGGNALDAANTIKTAYGEEICISTIQVGSDEAGRQLMRNMAEAGGCGYSVLADEVLSGPAMAAFVEKILFAPNKDADSGGYR